MINNRKVFLKIKRGEYFKTGNPNELLMSCVNPSCPSLGKGKYKLYYGIEQQAYHCKRCGISGRLENISFYGIKKKQEIQVDFQSTLPRGVYKIGNGSNGNIERDCIDYLIGRGLTRNDIEKYNIHYASSGLYIKRVIFPFIRDNKLKYFVARTIEKETEKKILNPRGKKDVFNIETAGRFNEIVLVEGVFDSIMTGDDSIAVLGHTISKHQIDIIKQYNIQKVNIMFDSDVDNNEIIGMAKKLRPHFKKVSIIRIPRGLGDPAEIKLRNISCVKGWKIFKEEEFSCITLWQGVNIKRKEE